MVPSGDTRLTRSPVLTPFTSTPLLKYTLPALSTATLLGFSRLAFVAGPPSPVYAQQAPPAAVEILPFKSTLRIDSPLAIYRLPEESTATPAGPLKVAEAAGPLSPDSPVWPVPAKVVIVPEGATFRTRLAAKSAIKRLPVKSTATPDGLLSRALIDDPPSPIASVLPATVEIFPAEIRRTRLLSPSTINRFPLESTANPLGL